LLLTVHKAHKEQIRKSNLIEDDTVFGDLMSEAGAMLSLDGSIVELCKLMSAVECFASTCAFII
jgi:hypothetical protein